MSHIESKLFTWRPVVAMQQISQEVLSGMTWPEEQLQVTGDSFIYSRVVHQLRSAVLSEDVRGHIAREARTVVFKVPATPWQHFKKAHSRAWWMRWLVARHPVQVLYLSRTVRFTAEWSPYVVYPWQRVVPTDSRFGPGVRHVQVFTHTDIA